MKEKEKHTEINAVSLKILSDIQTGLQHGPTVSNMDKHKLEKTQILFEMKMHGIERSNARRNTPKKARHGAKRNPKTKDSSEDSFSEGAGIPKELSNSDTSSHSRKREKKRKHSKGNDPK